jgi:hypothetical protein
LQVAPIRPDGAGLPAAARASLERFLRLPAALDLLFQLVCQMGLVQIAGTAPVKLDPARAQPFLQAALAERSRQLAEAWRVARDWNDLRRVPGLVFEGSGWRNDPLRARQALLDLLAGVPPGQWWSLDSFVASVKERQPDFQRPAGDYDSWYIRAAATQAYLRGFENWEQVDGALVRWIVGQPLVWLGLLDVSEPAGAFRVTPYGAAFWGQGSWDALPPDPSSALTVAADGQVRVPAGASAHDRFQIARIADWAPPESGLETIPGRAVGGVVHRYRLTPASLARAAAKGITVERVLAFLERAAPGQPAVPRLAHALRRWSQHGAEAGLYPMTVLKLSSQALLETLRQDPSVRGLLGETLGPMAVSIAPEHLPALRQALAELGIFVEE